MKKITVEVSDELVAFKDRQGIRWRSIMDLGSEAIQLRFENTELKEQLNRMQRANTHLQTEIFKLNDELDQLKAGVKP
jgi:regulator of replication initiation timing